MRTSVCWLFSPVLFHTIKFSLEHLMHYKVCGEGAQCLTCKGCLWTLTLVLFFYFSKPGQTTHHFLTGTYLPVRKGICDIMHLSKLIELYRIKSEP